jgi:predicted PurR-regulated permease PerM
VSPAGSSENELTRPPTGWSRSNDRAIDNPFTVGAPRVTGATEPTAASVPIGGLPAQRVLVLVAIVAVIFWIARPVLAPFVIAAVIAYAFTPVVAAVETRTGARHAVVVLALYVAALAVIVAGLALVGSRLLAELQLLASSGPDAIATLLRQLAGGDVLVIGGAQLPVADLARQLQASINSLFESPSGAIHFATQVAEVSLQAVLGLIVTFYFLLDGVRLRDAALRFLSPATRERTIIVGGRIHQVLGRWLRGTLFLIAVVALAVYVILGPILHVPYALALGLLTGVLEIIPLIGPIVAAAIAAVVAFSAGGSGLAITVIVVYFVLRQIEDQLVAPIVIGRAVDLHPVVTIFAVLVGISAWGVLGGLLAVPFAAALNVTLRELYPETVTAPD